MQTIEPGFHADGPRSAGVFIRKESTPPKLASVCLACGCERERVAVRPLDPDPFSAKTRSAARQGRPAIPFATVPARLLFV